MKKILTLLLLSASFVWAAEITFTFANVTYTGASPSYFEFDVMAQADAAGTRLGTNLVYINYNTAGFGSSIAAGGKVTVEKGTLLAGSFGPPAPYYVIVNVADNTASRFAVTSEYQYPGSPEYGNEVTTTPTQLFHVKIEIANSSENAGLSFEQSLMGGQQYESDNATKYSPVVATDTENSSLAPSTLEELVSAEIPDAYALHQNFPNPFNPVTMLQFDIPRKSENVKLVVYNVLGQPIARLYEGAVNPGFYRYQWNGQSDAGQIMPSGVYFAILSTDDYRQTIKMMLVK